MHTLDVAPKLYTIEEYLAREERATEKHEFLNGTLFNMAGALAPHNAVIINMIFMLEAQFRATQEPFFAFASDMKIRIERTNDFVYPDVSVVFEGPEFYVSPDGQVRRHTMTNPLLIVEVLSNKTRARDKGDKFEAYCTLPSFREYMLIEPEKTWLETRYLHDPAKSLWEIRTYTNLDDTFSLQSVGAQFKVADVYARLRQMRLG